MFYVRISNPIGWTNEEINFSHFGPTDRWGSGSFLEFGGNSIRCPSCTLVGGMATGTGAPRDGHSDSAKGSESSCSFPPGVNFTAFLSMPFFWGSL